MEFIGRPHESREAAASDISTEAISPRLSPQALERIEASKIVVVTGWYDHVELVLEALEIPFQAIYPEQLVDVCLRPQQTVIVNCPGIGLADNLVQLRAFVADGGTLFTTDRALRHVIEPGFPGILACAGRPMVDGPVGVHVMDSSDPLLAGVLEGMSTPQWWVAASSYSVRILAPARVEILLASSDLRDGPGEAPVALRFRHGRGQVVHVISHHYLQRDDLRERRRELDALSLALRESIESEPMRERPVPSSDDGSSSVPANVVASDDPISNPNRRGDMAERALSNSSGGINNTWVVGSLVRHKYHLPTCKWAQDIRHAHLRTYPSAAAAEFAGKRRCRTCRPGRPTRGTL